ncbi:glycosyltransferase family 9 protein [Verrucomicrobium sp. GAS474]|uniref:glycosyltransferase family 9 protein n=1 Tax=Verrucomicrobium sp. GAS474 TaxID=1882831 RepID=UPI0012FF99A0|nr:glycosyltransferase family 9 protein [Verrucomicrobium sp. GAS474]
MIRALSQGGYAVDILFPAAFLDLFASNPHIEKAMPLDISWRSRVLRLAATLREGKYDLLLLPNASPWQVTLAGLLSGIPKRMAMWGGIWGRLAGYRCLRSGIESAPRPYAEILLDMARALDIPIGHAKPEIFSTHKRKSLGGSLRVGIHLGAGGSACNLAPSAYAELASFILTETDWEIVLTGTKDEQRLLETWPHTLRSSIRVRNVMGGALEDLCREITSLDLLIISSTGPLHIAAALEVPTLSPFCSRPGLSPLVWGNQNENGSALVSPLDLCRCVGSGCYCDFSGKITPRDLFDHARSILG